MVALFLWVLLVSSTVLSLSEAKNPTKLQMTNSLNFQPPLKNLVKSQHHQLLQLQQDQNNIIYDKDDNQLLNQVSVSSSSTRKQTEILSTTTTRKNQHQRNHQNSKYSNHNRNRNRSNRNRNRKNKQHNTNQLRSQTKMDCTVNPDPIWIRNDCTDGFLAIISDRRVVTLNSRVDQHDNLGMTFLFFYYF